MGIIIMGETGSGKTTAGKILAYNSGLGLYEIGDEVKQVYLERIQADSLDNEKDYTTTNQRLKFTDEIVKKYGNDYYVKRILKKQDNENIIIGVRSMAEIRAIKNKIKFPFFVLLTCSEDEIIKRFIKRESKFMTEEEAIKVFKERKAREEKWGVEDISCQANITISTENEQPSVIADTIMCKYIEFLRKQQGRNKNIEPEEIEL